MCAFWDSLPHDRAILCGLNQLLLTQQVAQLAIPVNLKCSTPADHCQVATASSSFFFKEHHGPDCLQSNSISYCSACVQPILRRLLLQRHITAKAPPPPFPAAPALYHPHQLYFLVFNTAVVEYTSVNCFTFIRANYLMLAIRTHAQRQRPSRPSDFPFLQTTCSAVRQRRGAVTGGGGGKHCTHINI